MKLLENTVLKLVAGGASGDLEGLSPKCAAATLNGILFLIEHNKTPLVYSDDFYQNCTPDEIDIINKAAWPIWAAFIGYAQDLMKIAS